MPERIRREEDAPLGPPDAVPGEQLSSKNRVPEFVRHISLIVVALLLCASAAFAQEDENSILAVRIGGDVVKAGLSLTRIGVAEVGDQYAVGGTFIATRSKTPSQVTVKVLTVKGKSIKRTGRLQPAVGVGLAFVVFLPRQDGAIKLVTITR